MRIEYLAIEATRRCNMSCAHCLRGESQDMDIKKEYIDALFTKVSDIRTFTLSGGELTCAKRETIEHIIKSLKAHNVHIENAYIVINGKKIPLWFAQCITELFYYCQPDDDEFLPQVVVSRSQWHEPLTYQQEMGFKKLGYVYRYETKYLIQQGRSRQGRDLLPEDFVYDSDNCSIYEGTLYLNAKGFLIAGCDYSYEWQDNNLHGIQICHVNDLSFDVIKAYIDNCDQIT